MSAVVYRYTDADGITRTMRPIRVEGLDVQLKDAQLRALQSAVYSAEASAERVAKDVKGAVWGLGLVLLGGAGLVFAADRKGRRV